MAYPQHLDRGGFGLVDWASSASARKCEFQLVEVSCHISGCNVHAAAKGKALPPRPLFIRHEVMKRTRSCRLALTGNGYGSSLARAVALAIKGWFRWPRNIANRKIGADRRCNDKIGVRAINGGSRTPNDIKFDVPRKVHSGRRELARGNAKDY
ncbi:hypothetical protein K438DRAFT_1770494 [Mycena galopus ATCC 62051]|nr:hypothetical protein K438DRAFT_1770494 [Mycena galopus ATCC 62051]